LPALYPRLPGPWSGDFDNGPATSATEEIAVSKLKTRIAAGITVIGLGGLAGLALGSGEQQTAATAVAEKPVVRTKVIRRTIHVTKHAKPKHPAVSGSGGGALVASGSGGGQGSATTGSSSGGYGSSYSPSSESSPVTTSTSGASSAPSYESGSSESAPVTTSTSGGGSVSAGGGEGGGYESEGEHESEGGGDD
jgi:hypothetical protein